MIAFTTSGTTGAPVTWLRTEEQLAREADLLVSTVVGAVDRVVTYAPPHHLYGRIFGVEIPRLLDIPVLSCWDDPLAGPPIDHGERTLIVCLPSTWPLLRGLFSDNVIAVHSTARTTETVYEVANHIRGVEVLGSTETGAVATREIDHPDAEWHLLPDVRWLPGDLLRVASPRLGRRQGAVRPSTWWTMPDLVEPTGDRRFRHLGRAGRLIKVNGVRCDLGQVEALVRDAFPAIEVACVPHPDAVRGEHYDLRIAGPATPDEVRARLAEIRGALPAPRAVVRL